MNLTGGNLSLLDVISALPGGVTTNLMGLISILKAVGIVAIAYFIYTIVMGTLNFRKLRRLNTIEKKVISVEKKLDKLLKLKKKV